MTRVLIAFVATIVAAPLAAQGTRGATPPPKPAAPPAAAQGRGTQGRGAKPDSAKAKPDTGAAANSVAERGSRSQMTIMREVFSYSSGGRRDPMTSLMSSGELRPLPTEVQVTGIMYDELDPTRSTATLLNTVDKKTQYHVKVGQTLGRMKVAQITRRDVIFTIDEFGFSRQERMSIKPDTSKKGTP